MKPPDLDVAESGRPLTGAALHSVDVYENLDLIPLPDAPFVEEGVADLFVARRLERGGDHGLVLRVHLLREEWSGQVQIAAWPGRVSASFET